MLRGTVKISLVPVSAALLAESATASVQWA